MHVALLGKRAYIRLVLLRFACWCVGSTGRGVVFLVVVPDPLTLLARAWSILFTVDFDWCTAFLVLTRPAEAEAKSALSHKKVPLAKHGRKLVSLVVCSVLLLIQTRKRDKKCRVLNVHNIKTNRMYVCMHTKQKNKGTHLHRVLPCFAVNRSSVPPLLLLLLLLLLLVPAPSGSRGAQP